MIGIREGNWKGGLSGSAFRGFYGTGFVWKDGEDECVHPRIRADPKRGLVSQESIFEAFHVFSCVVT